MDRRDKDNRHRKPVAAAPFRFAASPETASSPAANTPRLHWNATYPQVTSSKDVKEVLDAVLVTHPFLAPECRKLFEGIGKAFSQLEKEVQTLKAELAKRDLEIAGLKDKQLRGQAEKEVERLKTETKLAIKDLEREIAALENERLQERAEKEVERLKTETKLAIKDLEREIAALENERLQERADHEKAEEDWVVLPA